MILLSLSGLDCFDRRQVRLIVLSSRKFVRFVIVFPLVGRSPISSSLNGYGVEGMI